MALIAPKGERTRALLLEIAVRRFAADGFRGTSVAAVAREAGLTPAAVYAYYPGKEGLFEAAVDADAHGLIAEALATLPDHGMVRTWPLWLTALTDRLDQHPLARRVLAGQEPEVIGRLLDVPALLELRARLARELRDGQTSGEVRTDLDAEAAAVGLESIVLALLIATLQVPEVDDERRDGVGAVLEAVLRPPAR